MSGHHLATVRRAGRKRGARFESSEALAEQPAVVRSAVELHGCCARTSLAEALLRQHIDGVARASSAGIKSRSIARSLVLLTMLAPVSRTARLEDQLGLDDEVSSEIADGYATGSSARRGVAVGDLPTSRASAVQLVLQTLGSARTPPVPVNFSVHSDLCHTKLACRARRRNACTYSSSPSTVPFDKTLCHPSPAARSAANRASTCS